MTNSLMALATQKQRTEPRSRKANNPQPTNTTDPARICLSVSALKRTLSILKTTIAVRSALPILSHIRLRPDPENTQRALFEATNLESWIRIAQDALIEGDLSQFPTLQHSQLTELVQKFPPDAEVVLTKTGSREEALLQCAQSQYRLNGLSAFEFPTLPEPETPLTTLSVNAVKFARLLRSVLPAASKEEARVILQTVRLEITAHQLRAVATDTHRLHVFIIEHEAEIETPLAALLDAETITRLLPIFDRYQPLTLQLALNHPRLYWTYGAMSGAISLVEGQYPNYERVIPQEYQWRFQTNSALLAEATQRLLTVADQLKLYIDYDPNEGALVLTARGDYADGKEIVPVTLAEGINGTEPETLCAMNGRYLLGAIQAIDASEIEMRGEQSLRPVMFRASNAPEAPLNGVLLMPMAP